MKPLYPVILFSIVLFVSYGNVRAQQLRFYRENIEIEVRHDECVLTGIYYFINNSDVKVSQNLYYPYVVNDSLPAPYKAEVRMLRNDRRIPALKTAKGIIFSVEAVPQDTCIAEVKYFQKTPVHMMEYILTTTKEWGRSFETAEYTVKIPDNYTLINMQPQFDKVTQTGNYNIYVTLKRNYLPQHNFVIVWKEDNNEKSKR